MSFIRFVRYNRKLWQISIFFTPEDLLFSTVFLYFSTTKKEPNALKIKGFCRSTVKDVISSKKYPFYTKIIFFPFGILYYDMSFSLRRLHDENKSQKELKPMKVPRVTRQLIENGFSTCTLKSILKELDGKLVGNTLKYFCILRATRAFSAYIDQKFYHIPQDHLVFLRPGRDLQFIDPEHQDICPDLYLRFLRKGSH